MGKNKTDRSGRAKHPGRSQVVRDQQVERRVDGSRLHIQRRHLHRRSRTVARGIRRISEKSMRSGGRSPPVNRTVGAPSRARAVPGRGKGNVHGSGNRLRAKQPELVAAFPRRRAAGNRRFGFGDNVGDRLRVGDSGQDRNLLPVVGRGPAFVVAVAGDPRCGNRRQE